MASPNVPVYRVLIVEDEYFIASDLARAVESAGLTSLGPVANEASALEILDSASVDFVIVDINLGGKTSFTLASDLRRRGIPFLFHTGYDASIIPQEFEDAVVSQKFTSDDVVARILLRRDKVGEP